MQRTLLDSKGAKKCESDTSSQALSNEYLFAKFGFDTAENESLKECEQLVQNLYQLQIQIGLQTETPERLPPPDAKRSKVQPAVLKTKQWHIYQGPIRDPEVSPCAAGSREKGENT